MLNDPAKVAGAKKPNAQVKINGKQLLWTNIEVETTNAYRAATFTLHVPTQNQPNIDFEKLTDTEELVVEINMDDGSGKLVRVLVGDADYIEEEWQTKIATISGRDYTARFIDENTTEKYPAYTSSQIIALLAEKHGLKTNITETSTPVGSYYNEQYSKMVASASEWDLMMFLAQREHFNLYLDGDTVVFKPQEDSKNYYIIEWKEVTKNVYESNSIRMRFKRNYTIANDLAVVVHGYDLYTQKKYTETARRRHSPTRGQKRQKYIASVSGITQEQAAQMAQNMALELSLHEKTLSVELSGDLILTPQSIIKVTGFSSRWDQLYYPVTINRRISYEGGFSMSVEAKNHDPNTQVDLA